MLKELKAHHRNIARLSFEGFKPSEIASRTSTSLQTVYNILRDPLCKGYVNGLADKADRSVLDVREKLAEMNTQALNTLSNLIEASSRETVPASVRLNAAKDVLDRTGYKAPERVEHAHAHFTIDDLRELQERANTIN